MPGHGVGQRRSKAARRAIAMGVLSSFGLAAAAGCGGDSSDSGSAAQSSSGSSGSKTSAAVLAEAKAATDKGYAGDFQPPPTEGPKAQTGKKVWYISCG